MNKQEKKVIITLRLAPQEGESVKEAARLDDRSVNQWCRLALIRAAGKEIMGS